MQAEDKIWVVIFAVAPAKVKLCTSEKHIHSHHVKAGMTKLSCRLELDKGMWATVKRDGAVVTECRPLSFCFRSRPAVHNFNAFVAMSD